MLARLGIRVDTSSFSKAEAAIAGLSRGLLKTAAVGAGVVVALKSIVEGTADHARETLRAARITGMSTDALQGLGYAAKVSGVSAEELQHGLIHLARSAREATLGGGGAGLAYSQLGIRVSNAAGKLRPLNDIFGDVVVKLSKMPDSGQKAALAMSLFGRAGAQLIPLLDEGPEGLARLTEEAKRLGIVMDEKTLAAGNRYRVTLDRLDGAVTGLKNSIAQRLFPAMTRSTEQFIAWISAHRKWIALKVEQSFRAVTQVLRGLLAIGVGVVNLFERVWKSGTAGKVALVALGAVVAGLVAPWMSLITVLALVAEDIEGYFEGRESITGRIVFAFEKLQKKLAKFGFKQIFVEGLEEAKKFFDYVDQQLARKLGGNGSGNTVADKDSLLEQIADYFRSGFASSAADVRRARGLPVNDQDDPANVFSGRPAFRSFPGSQFAYTPIGGQFYQVDAKTGAGSGAGPAFAPVINVSVGGTVGDPAKTGQDIANVVLPIIREEHARTMREAAAATDKRNVP